MGRGQTGDRNPERRTGNIVQANAMEELDAFGLTAMLAANADLEIGAGLASTLTTNFDHLAHTRLIDADKRIMFIEVMLDIEGQEVARIVAGEAVGRLGQVVGAEGEASKLMLTV